MIQLTDAGGETTAVHLADEPIHLVVSDVVTWEDGLRFADLDDDIAEARNVGLTMIDAILRADEQQNASLLAPDMFLLEDLSPVTSDEVMGLATERGFPFGYDFSPATIRDYVVNHEPAVVRLDGGEEHAHLLAQAEAAAGPGDFVMFRGYQPREGRELYLGTDLVSLVLADTADGWRVLAL